MFLSETFLKRVRMFGFIRGVISAFLGYYYKPDENKSVSLQVIFELARKLWDKN